MSNDLNRCNFIGRLGADPETRFLQSGKPVTNIRIAVGSSWKDKQTGEKQERVEWVAVTAYDKLAEIIQEYLKKGSQVFISGRLQTRVWQDKEGKDRYTTEIIADQMQMLGSKSSEEREAAPRGEKPKSAGKAKPTARAKPALEQQEDDDEFGDDVPWN